MGALSEDRPYAAVGLTASSLSQAIRREYGEFYDRVLQLFFESDPIGINFGDNADEYGRRWTRSCRASARAQAWTMSRAWSTRSSAGGSMRTWPVVRNDTREWRARSGRWCAGRARRCISSFGRARGRR
jgi:hypothetical protein